AYRCLAAMQARTARTVEATDAATEGDAMIAKAHLTHRLRSLEADVAAVGFGRRDEEPGDTWYVGRRHVEDQRGDPVVVDWRGDVGGPVYSGARRDTPAARRPRAL